MGTAADRGRGVLSFAIIVAQCGSCFLAALPSATASSISITTGLTMTPRSGPLAVSLETTNAGDEAVEAVVAGTRFAGHEVRAPSRPKLAPGESVEVALEIPWAPPSSGQWPLTTKVDYADRNGYAFQALQVALVSAAAASPALLAVLKVEAAQVAGMGRVDVRLKSLSEVARHARVQFFVPEASRLIRRPGRSKSGLGPTPRSARRSSIARPCPGAAIPFL